MEFERGISDVSGLVFRCQLEKCIRRLNLPFKRQVPLAVVFENKRLSGRFSQVFEE